MIELILATIAAGAGAAALAAGAALSLLWLEPDPTTRARLRTPALAFALWPVLMLLGFGGGALLAAFGGLALTAAWVDRQTAWVPEAVLVPALMLGGALGWGGWAGAAAGGAVFVLAHLGWVGQVAIGRHLVPPPDLAALALPPLVLGMGSATVVAYGVVAGLLVLCLRVPALRRALSPEAPLGAALADTGRAEPPAAAVAFLPVIVPPVVILALAS